MARANRVRQLIGDRHWLTDGHHKEAIVRELLIRYVPASLNVGSGFIKSRDGASCSPEIDILISDSSTHPPYFNEGGIQITPPSSAVAVIEMKSTFDASSLSGALNAIQGTQSVLEDSASNVWRCIFFAVVEREFDSFIKTVLSKISDALGEIDSADAKKAALRLPTCIASFEKFVMFARADIEDNSLVLNFFDFGSVSASVAFSDLFEHIRSFYGKTQSGELSDIVLGIPNAGHIKHVVKMDHG